MPDTQGNSAPEHNAPGQFLFYFTDTGLNNRLRAGLLLPANFPRPVIPREQRDRGNPFSPLKNLHFGMLR